mgnify:CR=1 FL=1
MITLCNLCDIPTIYLWYICRYFYFSLSVIPYLYYVTFNWNCWMITDVSLDPTLGPAHFVDRYRRRVMRVLLRLPFESVRVEAHIGPAPRVAFEANLTEVAVKHFKRMKALGSSSVAAVESAVQHRSRSRPVGKCRWCGLILALFVSGFGWSLQARRWYVRIFQVCRVF